MHTAFATSNDGTRIAYERFGSGSPIILLRDDFTVITIDIRGNGESNKPIDTFAYTIANHCNDILAVADTCGFDRFALWGFSYGGNIGRFLAAQSDRVRKLIVMGIPFGLAIVLIYRKRRSP